MTKVLMFGWEYPPEISGGLGIATQVNERIGQKALKTQICYTMCSDKLANAVEDLVKNPVETLKYAYKLQAEAGKRTWDKAADEVIEIYDKLS